MPRQGETMEPEETQEGQRPARRFTPRIFLYLGVIGVVVIVVLAGWVVLVNKQSGITAMEGRGTADGIAHQWNNSAKLYYVISNGKVYANGYCDAWQYSYITQPANVTETIRMEIVVYSDGSNTSFINDEPMIVSSINNWTYDSDDIVNNAKNNLEVKTYLSKYSDSIERIAIVGSESYGEKHVNGCLWNIQWSDPGLLDNPHSIRIWLDGSTGEVLSVEADT